MTAHQPCELYALVNTARAFAEPGLW